MLKGLNLIKYKPKIIIVEDVFDDIELNRYIIKHDYNLVIQSVVNKFYKLNEN